MIFFESNKQKEARQFRQLLEKVIQRDGGLSMSTLLQECHNLSLIDDNEENKELSDGIYLLSAEICVALLNAKEQVALQNITNALSSSFDEQKAFALQQYSQSFAVDLIKKVEELKGIKFFCLESSAKDELLQALQDLQNGVIGLNLRSRILIAKWQNEGTLLDWQSHIENLKTQISLASPNNIKSSSHDFLPDFLSDVNLSPSNSGVVNHNSFEAGDSNSNTYSDYSAVIEQSALDTKVGLEQSFVEKSVKSRPSNINYLAKKELLEETLEEPLEEVLHSFTGENISNNLSDKQTTNSVQFSKQDKLSWQSDDFNYRDVNAHPEHQLDRRGHRLHSSVNNIGLRFSRRQEQHLNSLHNVRKPFMALAFMHIFIAIAFYLFCFGVNQAYTAGQIRSNGVETTGTVVDVIKVKRTEHDMHKRYEETFTYSELISFKRQDGSIAVASLYPKEENEERYDVGQKIKILYDPKDYTHILDASKHTEFYYGLATVIFSVVFFLIVNKICNKLFIQCDIYNRFLPWIFKYLILMIVIVFQFFSQLQVF